MSKSESPPVGTQAERDLDTRLDKAITDSSSLVEEALTQLAMPCDVADEEADDYDLLTPIDLAISISSELLGEAREQLTSPTSTPIELTDIEAAEKKAAQAWSTTYRQIKQTNEVRSDASQDFAESILTDMEEADEGVALLSPPKYPSAVDLKTIDFSRSSSSLREEKRAKRLSRTCCGPRVAAVVAKIEAIDETAAPCQPSKTSAHSVGK